MWLDRDGSASDAALAPGTRRVVFSTRCLETGSTVMSNACMDLAADVWVSINSRKNNVTTGAHDLGCSA